MGIFRRDKNADHDPADHGDLNEPGGTTRPDEDVEAFWRWWNTEGAMRWATLAGGSPPAADQDDLDRRVSAIGDGLVWQIAPGSESAHLLIVSADGDPALRAPAARWRAGAPEADFVWSFADARPARHDLQDGQVAFPEAPGLELDLARASVGVHRTGTRLDVTVHHPDLVDLDAAGRTAGSFTLVDAALGERGTESWVGELAFSEVAPLDGFGLAGLRAVVRDLAAEFQDTAGRPSWVQMRGSGPTGAVAAGALVPLAAAAHPLLSRHLMIQTSYRDRDGDGLPGRSAAGKLGKLQQSVTAALGDDGLVVATESTGGFSRLHCYVDERSSAQARAEHAVGDWNGQAQVLADDDPGWSEVQHLRG